MATSMPKEESYEWGLKAFASELEAKTTAVYYDGEKTFSVAEVYLDENILVADKPKGITSEDYESLVKTKYSTATLCHRLDRNTDGLICFALNENAEKELLLAFKNRDIDKYYLAEVYGAFKNKKDTLTAYLVKNSADSTVKIFSNKVDMSISLSTAH